MMMFSSCLALLLAGVSLTLAVGDEEELVTLQYGDDVGDHFGPYSAAGDFVSGEIQLDGRYIFYGKEQRSLYISENGVISFEEPFSDPFPQPLPLTIPTSGTSLPPPFIAGFWGDINVPKNGGAIFFIEMNQRINGRFGRARAKVLNLLREGFGRSMEDFFPTHIFLCTWESVHENDPGIAKRAVTFQIVLVTDSTRTYVLLLYSDVRWDRSNGHGVFVGFNAGDGVRSFTHPASNVSILDLDFSTNARTLGAHVYRVDQREINEPTDLQKSEQICILSFNGSRELEKQYRCDCPTESKPILAYNKINCLQKPLAVSFHNDTPLVVGSSVRALFRPNRPGVQLSCHIPKIDRRNKQDCSSGKFERRNISPGRYSLRVIARDPDTRDRAVLRGYFVISRVPPSTRDLPCTATVINTSSEKMGSRVEVEFRGSAAARSFQCRLDQGDNQPCESPFVMEGLSAGRHRVVVIPAGPQCTRRNRDTASHSFTVQSS